MNAAEQLLRKRTVRTQWGLLGQWWCVPLDYTAEEEGALLTYLRNDLGPDFAVCPLAYIKDQLHGGFDCENGGDRRHIYFAVGNYSFISASQGRYWEATSSDRARTYARLLEDNADHYSGDGPFTADAPSAGEQKEEKCQSQ